MEHEEGQDEEGQDEEGEEEEERGEGEGVPPGLGEGDRKEAAKPSSTEATPEGRLVSIHTPFLARVIVYVYTYILFCGSVRPRVSVCMGLGPLA